MWIHKHHNMAFNDFTNEPRKTENIKYYSGQVKIYSTSYLGCLSWDKDSG